MARLALGIETSCDDTSVAIVRCEGNPTLPWANAEVLFQKTFDQTHVFKEWGGVVPELAGRYHAKKLAPLIKEAIESTQTPPETLSVIGVTTRPGLLGPLLTGLSAAKTMSMLFKFAINPVNHLQAHLEAIHLTEKVHYPYMGLLLSGGHTAIVLVDGPQNFKLLGTTIDDAAGEAFDKGAKLLGLPYPGGAVIDQIAKQGNPEAIAFPRGMKKHAGLDVSYSGLKAALKRHVEEHQINSDTPEYNDVVASYQEAIVDTILGKLKKAWKDQGKHHPIVVGGGVACNSRLRHVIAETFPSSHFVAPRYCTDNGAMIAHYALRTPDRDIQFPECLELNAKARGLDEL